MAHNLRTTVVAEEKYVNVIDLLKMIVDTLTIEGLHPAAIQALDGFGIGLSISLGIVNIQDLPEDIQLLVKRLTDD